MKLTSLDVVLVAGAFDVSIGPGKKKLLPGIWWAITGI